MEQQMTERNAPIAQRFSRIEPQEFGQNLDEVWQQTQQGCEALKETLSELVVQGVFSPIQAYEIFSYAVSRTVGFQSGQQGSWQPHELAAALTPSLR